MKNYKISMCVVCMNRLHQLKQTLLQNIKDNESYDNLEFILLDYNSHDGMEEWIWQEMMGYVLSGRLIYYKTTQPLAWTPSHSKNLAFKLATGDIICNIWADYYTGENFAEYVNAEYIVNHNIVLTPIDFPKTKIDFHPQGDVLGKVCVKKEDFIKIGGFDERMNKHGYEDYDFINRLEMIGVKRKLIEDFKWLRFISHSNLERFELPTENLQSVFINYKTPSKSSILFFYKDQNFEQGVLIDNFTKNAANYRYAFKQQDDHFAFSVEGTGWQSGKWAEVAGTIKLMPGKNKHHIFKRYSENAQEILIDIDDQLLFYRVSDEKMIRGVLVFKHFTYTRLIMEESLKNKMSIANQNEFGKATVYKNFQPEPIRV